VKSKILACLIAVGLGFGGIALAEEVKPLSGTAATNQTNTAPPIYDVKEGARYPKNYLQQPPLIPHRIDKYEIDLKVNMCLRCHDWPNNVEENAPLISVTHFFDRDNVRLDHVSSRRWFCVQCHVPQADAKPLVENKFQPATGK
jgi:cytochrome c-type protein NapB